MLESLKERLKELAVLPTNTFADRVQRRTGADDASEPAKDLQAFVLVLPDMIAQLRVWMDDPKTPKSLKELHGYMLTYLFHPVDFLPEDKEGLFGYLDDAYLVASVYARIYSGLDPSRRKHLPHMEEITRQIPGWMGRVEALLPAETRKISSMLHELSEDNPVSFNRMMEQTAKRP